jgi:hypothetical protein
MLNDWQRVAREFGDYNVAEVHKDYETYATMTRETNEVLVGDWLPSEPTAKEILRLRKRVEVLEACEKLVREYAEARDNWDGWKACDSDESLYALDRGLDRAEEALYAAGKEIAK